MTWGEIQLISVKKMFLNTVGVGLEDLPMMRIDKKYAIYMNAMPETANEGIKIMITRGKPYIKSIVLDETMIDETRTNNDEYCIDLSKKIENYGELCNVIVNNRDYNDYIIRYNRYLYLPKHMLNGKVVEVSYKSIPEQIDVETLDTDVIDLPYDMLNILPLYIASELYKDDDISIATIYRNEFEAELENMRHDVNDVKFTSVNGWL